MKIFNMHAVQLQKPGLHDKAAACSMRFNEVSAINARASIIVCVPMHPPILHQCTAAASMDSAAAAAAVAEAE